MTVIAKLNSLVSSNQPSFVGNESKLDIKKDMELGGEVEKRQKQRQQKSKTNTPSVAFLFFLVGENGLKTVLLVNK